MSGSAAAHTCDLCESEPAVIRCMDCAPSGFEYLCANDEKALHQDAKKKKHKRIRIADGSVLQDGDDATPAPSAPVTPSSATVAPTALSTNSSLASWPKNSPLYSTIPKIGSSSPSHAQLSAPTTPSNHALAALAVPSPSNAAVSGVGLPVKRGSMFVKSPSNATTAAIPPPRRGSALVPGSSAGLGVSPLMPLAVSANRNKLASPTTAASAPPAFSRICDICDTDDATVYCDSCKRDNSINSSQYCASCNDDFHIAKKLDFHFRRPFDEEAIKMMQSTAELHRLNELDEEEEAPMSEAIMRRRAQSVAKEGVTVKEGAKKLSPAEVIKGTPQEQLAALKIQSMYRGASTRKSVGELKGFNLSPKATTSTIAATKPTAAASASVTTPSSAATTTALKPTASSPAAVTKPPAAAATAAKPASAATTAPATASTAAKPLAAAATKPAEATPIDTFKGTAEEQQAATKIQAIYRGASIRRSNSSTSSDGSPATSPTNKSTPAKVTAATAAPSAAAKPVETKTPASKPATTTSTTASAAAATPAKAKPAAAPASSESSLSLAPLCSMCETNIADVHCNACDMDLCVANGCDADMHRAAKNAGHQRTKIGGGEAKKPETATTAATTTATKPIATPTAVTATANTPSKLTVVTSPTARSGTSASPEPGSTEEQQAALKIQSLYRGNSVRKVTSPKAANAKLATTAPATATTATANTATPVKPAASTGAATPAKPAASTSAALTTPAATAKPTASTTTTAPAATALITGSAEEQQAATKIQAVYRGTSLRKRTSSASSPTAKQVTATATAAATPATTAVKSAETKKVADKPVTTAAKPPVSPASASATKPAASATALSTSNASPAKTTTGASQPPSRKSSVINPTPLIITPQNTGVSSLSAKRGGEPLFSDQPPRPGSAPANEDKSFALAISGNLPETGSLKATRKSIFQPNNPVSLEMANASFMATQSSPSHNSKNNNTTPPQQSPSLVSLPPPSTLPPPVIIAANTGNSANKDAPRGSLSSGPGVSEKGLSMLLTKLDVLESRLKKDTASLAADRAAFEKEKQDFQLQIEKEKAEQEASIAKQKMEHEASMSKQRVEQSERLKKEYDAFHTNLVEFEQRSHERIEAVEKSFRDRMEQTEKGSKDRLETHDKSVRERLEHSEKLTVDRLETFEKTSMERLKSTEKTMLESHKSFGEHTKKSIMDLTELNKSTMDSYLASHKISMDHSLDQYREEAKSTNKQLSDFQTNLKAEEMVLHDKKEAEFGVFKAEFMKLSSDTRAEMKKELMQEFRKSLSEQLKAEAETRAREQFEHKKRHRDLLKKYKMIYQVYTSIESEKIREKELQKLILDTELQLAPNQLILLQARTEMLKKKELQLHENIKRLLAGPPANKSNPAASKAEADENEDALILMMNLGMDFSGLGIANISNEPPAVHEHPHSHPSYAQTATPHHVHHHHPSSMSATARPHSAASARTPDLSASGASFANLPTSSPSSYGAVHRWPTGGLAASLPVAHQSPSGGLTANSWIQPQTVMGTPGGPQPRSYFDAFLSAASLANQMQQRFAVTSPTNAFHTSSSASFASAAGSTWATPSVLSPSASRPFVRAEYLNAEGGSASAPPVAMGGGGGDDLDDVQFLVSPEGDAPGSAAAVAGTNAEEDSPPLPHSTSRGKLSARGGGSSSHPPTHPHSHVLLGSGSPYYSSLPMNSASSSSSSSLSAAQKRAQRNGGRAARNQAKVAMESKEAE